MRLSGLLGRWLAGHPLIRQALAGGFMLQGFTSWTLGDCPILLFRPLRVSIPQLPACLPIGPGGPSRALNSPSRPGPCAPAKGKTFPKKQSVLMKGRKFQQDDSKRHAAFEVKTAPIAAVPFVGVPNPPPCAFGVARLITAELGFWDHGPCLVFDGL